MPLEFRRRRFRMPGKKGQIILAVVLLLLAAAVTAAWIVVSYQMDKAKQTASADMPDASSEPVTAVYTPQDAATVLLMLTDTGHERFTLVQADPAGSALRVAAVPELLAVGEDTTLVGVYRKSGAAAAVEAVQTALELPVRHYIAMTAEQAEEWLNYLENGVAVTLPEAVSFTDDRGIVLRLEAGERNLTATQAVALLRYTGWSDPQTDRLFHAQIVTAMLQRYFTPERRLGTDFAALSNTCRTSLRISDFNLYREKLVYLAGQLQADGAGLQTVTLSGRYTDDRFVFDRKATGSATGLYE